MFFRALGCFFNELYFRVTKQLMREISFFNISMFIFIWLCQVLVAACRIFSFKIWACGIQFPDQGSNPGPLHWELGVLATGPPGKFWENYFFYRKFKLITINGMIELDKPPFCQSCRRWIQATIITDGELGNG